MIDIELTNFDIDLANIWNYACESYSPEGKNASAYKELYYFLGPLYLNRDVKPFLSPEIVASGTYGQDYYDSYYYDRSQQIHRDIIVYTFEWQGSFYNMLTPCMIKREKTNPLVYQRLFSLKLSQYKHGLIHLKEFLSYHLSKSFNNDQKEFYDFLHVTLIQESELLGKTVIDQVNRIMSSSDPLPKLPKPEKLPYYRQSIEGMKALLENPDDIQDGTYESPEKENESSEKEMPVISDFGQEIPPGFEIIDGKLTNRGIFEFFKFLFLEKSENGNPFLPENAVRKIFRYGMAIPPHGIPETKYTLNTSLRFPRAIVDFAIHKFFMLYTNSRKSKQKIIRFFASYLTDYSDSLTSKNKMDMLSRNITGNKPARMNFSIKKYEDAVSSK